MDVNVKGLFCSFTSHHARRQGTRGASQVILKQGLGQLFVIRPIGDGDAECTQRIGNRFFADVDGLSVLGGVLAGHSVALGELLKQITGSHRSQLCHALRARAMNAMKLVGRVGWNYFLWERTHL